MKLYRGTRRKGRAGLQKVTSWTPSLPVAVIYSAHPGDIWSSQPAYFLPTSTIHTAHMDDDTKVLDLCGNWSHCQFWKVMQLLKYNEPKGLTYEEALDLAQYLHERLTGRIKGGEFSFVLFDEDGNEPMDDSEVPFMIDHPQSLLSWEFMPELSEDPEEMAPRLYVDSYAYADSPTFVTVARRLGYEAVVYQDVFQGGEFSAPPLLGCDAYDLEGVEEGEDIYEDETFPMHKTVRPLKKGVLTDFEKEPTEDVLPEVSCKAANPSKLKARLLR